MFTKSVQNRSFSSEICPENFHEISRFLPIIFQRNLPPKFLRILCEIGCFSANLTLQIPQKLEWFFCDLSEALLRLCHCQHLHECEVPLLCRHERSCCLIDKVYYKECFDFEGSKAMKTVAIIESRSKGLSCSLLLVSTQAVVQLFQ